MMRRSLFGFRAPTRLFLASLWAWSLLGCYSSSQYRGDGRLVANPGYYQMPFTLWLPDMDLAQPGERRFTLDRPPPNSAWIQLLFPSSADALARLTEAGTSVEVRLLDSTGHILFEGGGILPKNELQPQLVRAWVCNGGDPDTMWSLCCLPRLNAHASYTLILLVKAAEPPSQPVMCSPRVNALNH